MISDSRNIIPKGLGLTILRGHVVVLSVSREIKNKAKTSIPGHLQLACWFICFLYLIWPLADYVEGIVLSCSFTE
jgi:hypothetical protein